MQSDPLAQLAANAIAAKAQRLAGKPGEGDVKAAKKVQRAVAMLRLAFDVSGDALYAASADTLAGPAPSESATAADREAAAKEVYSLALRRAETGASGKREALRLYDIALSLHYESYWAYSRGLLLDALGEYEAAAAALEAVQGTYEQFARDMAKRCRGKAAGTYDEHEEMRRTFADLQEKLPGGAAIKGILDHVLGAFKSQADRPEQPANENREHLSELDEAAATAQRFAECLVDGRYEDAKALLSTSLKMSADELQAAHRQMTDYGMDGEADQEIDVCVISSSCDMPQLEVSDLGMVYVAITGDGFNEAVNVIVTQEQGAARIREIEWGRP